MGMDTGRSHRYGNLHGLALWVCINPIAPSPPHKQLLTAVVRGAMWWWWPAANPLFTYLLCLGTNILMGSNAPKKGELVEAAYYILVDAYYCLVPVNEHEHVMCHCSCSFTGTKQ